MVTNAQAHLNCIIYPKQKTRIDIHSILCMAEHKSERVHNTRKICNRFHIGHYKIFNEPELIEPMCIFRLYAPMIIMRMDALSSAFAFHSQSSYNQYISSLSFVSTDSLSVILSFAANKKTRRQ